MNSFGRTLRVSSWGSSHGAGIGVLIDGLPAGLKFDEALLRARLAERAGGGLGTPRKEPDLPELLSGIERGYTTGDPVALFVRNQNTRSHDYDDVLRPAHADFGYRAKFARALGPGGGRASARESLAKVIAGAFAAMFLRHFGVRVHAALCGVGGVQIEPAWSEEEFLQAAANADELGLCALARGEAMREEILSARARGDSVGASIAAAVFGAPAGLGEVLYDKLDARIAQYLMNLNAVKAVEFGAGAALAQMRGSQANDEITLAQFSPACQAAEANLSARTGVQSALIETGRVPGFRAAEASADLSAGGGAIRFRGLQENTAAAQNREGLSECAESLGGGACGVSARAESLGGDADGLSGRADCLGGGSVNPGSGGFTKESNVAQNRDEFETTSQNRDETLACAESLGRGSADGISARAESLGGVPGFRAVENYTALQNRDELATALQNRGEISARAESLDENTTALQNRDELETALQNRAAAAQNRGQTPASRSAKSPNFTEQAILRGAHTNAAVSASDSLGQKSLLQTSKNLAGGVLGGLSTGESICLRAHFKPTPSIACEQTIARPSGELFRGRLRGRHDPCVGVRAAVIVRSLIELAVADFMLLNATARMDYLENIYKEFKCR